VFILKTLKVICFHGLLQVLILKNLPRLNCTKIVQNADCLASIEYKELGALQAPKSKNASGKLALDGTSQIVT
jgi:hypothetical protein